MKREDQAIRSPRHSPDGYAPLGITDRLDYDGKDGPSGQPDLKGFDSGGGMAFSLSQDIFNGQAVHVGFLAASQAQVDAAYAAAIKAGAADNSAPGKRLYNNPRYYAANVFDPDSFSQ